jgi:hypothetical protein
MSFRNELIAKTKGLPTGLYWGIYFGNERAGDLEGRYLGSECNGMPKAYSILHSYSAETYTGNYFKNIKH